MWKKGISHRGYMLFKLGVDLMKMNACYDQLKWFGFLFSNHFPKKKVVNFSKKT